MPVNFFGTDPVTAPPVERVEELIAFARQQLGLGPGQPWVLVSSSIKLTKIFFEVDQNGLRIIGKASQSDRSAGTFDILTRLRDAGLCPPSPYVVVRPVGWFPERHLLLQEKAQGTQLLELIRSRSPEALPGVERAAHWLHALQSLDLDAAHDLGQTSVLARLREELSRALPAHAAVLERLLGRCEAAFSDAGRTVPGHGDFHPMNIFIADDSVTAIDLDTFALREAAYDVAYFAAQTAIMGYHLFESFEATRKLRARFLEAAPQVDGERLRLLVAFALLRSLHYDLCILKIDNEAQVAPFLHAAEYGLDA